MIVQFGYQFVLRHDFPCGKPLFPPIMPPSELGKNVA